MDVDEALAVFGETRRRALSTYRAVVAAAGAEDWLGEGPGHLPWWKLGRPRSKLLDRELQLDDERPRIGLGGVSTDLERPEMGMEEYLRKGALALGTTVEALVGPSREASLVEARELLTIVAVERYGLLVKSMAASFNRHVETASRWISRGTRRRQEDRAYRRRLDHADRAIASTRNVVSCP